VYEDHGEHMFEAGDSCLQPPGIVHDEMIAQKTSS